MDRRHFIHGLAVSSLFLTGCSGLLGGKKQSIDASELKTYSTASYSVKYPGKWMIDADNPSSVTIYPQQNKEGEPLKKGEIFSKEQWGLMTINTGSASMTLEEFKPRYKRLIKQIFDNVTIIGEQSDILPGGHSATIFDMEISGPQSNDITIRGKSCLAIANETVYMVQIYVLKEIYSSAKQALNTIVTSLTVI